MASGLCDVFATLVVAYAVFSHSLAFAENDALVTIAQNEQSSNFQFSSLYSIGGSEFSPLAVSGEYYQLGSKSNAEGYLKNVSL